MKMEFLRHFTYLAMQVYFIGGVAFVLWAFHFRFLWARLGKILTGVALVTGYALPLDAFGVVRGWGGFNPAYVTGMRFFGMVYLEEVSFWLGTSFVTISAVMIFAELERRGLPWWSLPAGVVLPVGWLSALFPPSHPE